MDRVILKQQLFMFGPNEVADRRSFASTTPGKLQSLANDLTIDYLIMSFGWKVNLKATNCWFAQLMTDDYEISSVSSRSRKC